MKDAATTQPFFGGEGQAIASVDYVSNLLHPSKATLTWKHPDDGRTVSASSVAKQAAKFMAQHGVENEPIEMADASWLDQYELAMANPVSSDRASQVYPITCVVCSLDPVIVICALVPYGSVYRSESVNSYIPRDESALRTDSVVVGLPRGMAYGRRVPMSQELFWCAPEIGLAPQPVRLDAAGVGEISEDWGGLKLVPEDDIYRVQALP
ncbi:MAG: hypothetical protein AAFR38_13140 [Planctomycetota bacterium]